MKHFESWRGQPSPLTHPGHFKNKRENAKKIQSYSCSGKVNSRIEGEKEIMNNTLIYIHGDWRFIYNVEVSYCLKWNLTIRLKGRCFILKTVTEFKMQYWNIKRIKDSISLWQHINDLIQTANIQRGHINEKVTFSTRFRVQ